MRQVTEGYIRIVNPTVSESSITWVLRRGVLAVFLFGCAGTLVELILLEHYDGWKQWVPLGLLVLSLLGGGIAGRASRPAFLRAFAFILAADAVAGCVGLWFHYAGNMEFELERTPELAGLALLRAAMEGATPALAPGTLVQFAALGFLFLWRHPRLSHG